MKKVGMWALRIGVALVIATVVLLLLAPEAIKVTVASIRLKWAKDSDIIKNAQKAFGANIDNAVKRVDDAVKAPGDVG